MDVQVENTYRIIATIVEDSVPVDISTASVKKIRIKEPDGTTSETSVGFVTDGTDGKLYYDHNPDQTGLYRFQFYLELGNFKGYSEPSSINSRANV